MLSHPTVYLHVFPNENCDTKRCQAQENKRCQAQENMRCQAQENKRCQAQENKRLKWSFGLHFLV